MIKIETFYACSDEELSEKLNEIKGRIIKVDYKHDDKYKIIYDDNCVQITHPHH